MWLTNELGEPVEAHVVARIAYAMIVRQYRYLKYNPEYAHLFVGSLSRGASEMRLGRLDLALAAYAWHLRQGMLLKMIRATMLQHAQEGHTLRRCMMWSYKAPWASDPPVSNTGVTSPRTKRGGSAL